MSGYTPKQINERKLAAFSIGTMGKRSMTRIEEEKRKKKEEEERINSIYKEFEEHFDDNPKQKISKTWVKAGTFNAGNRKEDSVGKGEIYKPQSKLAELAESFSSKKRAMEEAAAKKAADLNIRPDKPGKKGKDKGKKKSNLEIFKDELKAIQVEREERQKYKAMIKAGGAPIPGKSLLDIPPGGQLGDSAIDADGDPSSTNIYLANVSPQFSESELTRMFGSYGPLASVKIMYPRTDEERARGKNCGFVAYMSRADGERAMAAMLGKEYYGMEMRMSWGKPVGLPLQPFYIPPALMKYMSPPPQSGLPFNCQPSGRDAKRWGLQAISNSNPRPCEMPEDSKGKKKFGKMLMSAVIKVVIPTDRTQLCLINRMVEFVVREGPIFEATIMNRELNNPMFKFLFENQSPEHIYYRWRLYSVLQGDTKDNWNRNDFIMFKGGSIWRPPVPNLFTSGMPRELLDENGASVDPDLEKAMEAEMEDDLGGSGSKATNKPAAIILPGKKPLTDTQRDSLETTLRALMPDRNSIAESMVWCIEQAECAEEVVECIAESLSIIETPIVKKIARLFLMSDILHNCTVKMPNVSFYRTGFQAKLLEIFSDVNKTFSTMEDRRQAEAFKQRVMCIFNAWEDWHLYPMDFLIKCQNQFLGLVTATEPEEDIETTAKDTDGDGSGTDDDVDGLPLDAQAALLKGASAKVPKLVDRSGSESEDDADGTPLDQILLNKNRLSPAPPPPAGAFIKSKWETVDPEQVKAQAVTTSKWEREENDELVKARKALMGSVASKWERDDSGADSNDGEPIERGDGASELDAKAAEVRRQILRDIEVKVMAYQDELETGDKGVKSGWSINEQVEHYRKKLLRKALEQTPAAHNHKNNNDHNRESGEHSDEGLSRSSTKKKKRKRDRSASSSSTPDRNVRSRSRSRDKRSSKKKRERSRERSYSSSPDRSRNKRDKRDSPKRSKRSRSRTPKKHKKKRR